jgi:hypothetical protein
MLPSSCADRRCTEGALQWTVRAELGRESGEEYSYSASTSIIPPYSHCVSNSLISPSLSFLVIPPHPPHLSFSSFSSYSHPFSFFPPYPLLEIVNLAIGESAPPPESVKSAVPGPNSAGVSAVSGCAGAIIGEIEGWGELWNLGAEGEGGMSLSAVCDEFC